MELEKMKDEKICSMCGGKCCRGAAVSPEEYKALCKELHLFGLTPEQAFEPWKSKIYGETHSTRKSKNFCVFLDEKQLCKIHSRLGYEAKPNECKLFPFDGSPHRLCPIWTHSKKKVQ
jgi:Fe-S-cluster containining protein